MWGKWVCHYLYFGQGLWVHLQTSPFRSVQEEKQIKKKKRVGCFYYYFFFFLKKSLLMLEFYVEKNGWCVSSTCFQCCIKIVFCNSLISYSCMWLNSVISKACVNKSFYDIVVPYQRLQMGREGRPRTVIYSNIVTVYVVTVCIVVFRNFFPTPMGNAECWKEV